MYFVINRRLIAEICGSADIAAPYRTKTGPVKPEDLEIRMRRLESFRSWRLRSDTWTIIRLDGRSFSKFTGERFEKPFDGRFRDLMITAAKEVFTSLNGIYAYIFSDEISVLFPPSWCLFGRRAEKIISVSAGLAAAAFTNACGEKALFDSRIWLGENTVDVTDYFQLRQWNAGRCALHSWCYWTLRKSGEGLHEANEKLRKKDAAFQRELLRGAGIDFNNIPIWQTRGMAIYMENYQKEGYNPLTRESVSAMRKRIKTDLELPVGRNYRLFVERMLQSCISQETGTIMIDPFHSDGRL